MSLPNDVCRCLGMRCDMRKQCARYAVFRKDWCEWMSGEKTEPFSVSERLCQTPELEFFIPAEQISE